MSIRSRRYGARRSSLSNLHFWLTFFRYDWVMKSSTVPRSTPAAAAATRIWRLRLLLWAALLGLLVGIGELGEPLEDMLRDVRDMARNQRASGDLVIVGIDDRSLTEINTWPWPRRNYATLLEKLEQARARAISFDIDLSSHSNPVDDEMLRSRFQKARVPVTLPVQRVVDPSSGKEYELLPLPGFRREVELASITVTHNFRGQVRELPYQVTVAGHAYPGLASKISRVSGPGDRVYPIDFSIDPRTIPTISAADVMEGRADPALFTGKSVLIAATTSQLGDEFMIPGRGMMSGVYLQALGAETLRRGRPVDVGWLLPSLLTMSLAMGLAFLRDLRLGAAGGAAGIIALCTVPILTESMGYAAEVVPALVSLLIVSGGFGWRILKHFYRSRGSINSTSGLPNLNVLREEAAAQDAGLVIAKVHNYAEIASALPESGEEALVQQLARRLALSAGGSRIYHGDEGIFAWLAPQDKQLALGHTLSALYRAFRVPTTVGDRQVDVTLTFGADFRKDQPLASRLGSGIVAADEALREGLEWKQYDPARHEDMDWKLSLLSQLDQAIDDGHLWLAFQPKLHLASRRIVGAEALARWDHPEKGPINPADFILAAEQSGRIAKLTNHVIEKSIEAAARLNRQGHAFSVAVNLSARLIEGPALAKTIERLLAKYRLPARCLVLEITETAALAGTHGDLGVLDVLRDLGVNLSIDDYGTGLSTLDYMKRIPASEIKIDKSFIQTIEGSRSDRLMVHSTIQLAHSLGQKVVAEGVERAETLELLVQLGCDLAQGYLIGHPVPIAALEQRMAEQRQAA